MVTYESAYFGQPPANQHDIDILNGLFGSPKAPPIEFPPNRSDETRGPQLIVGISFAITLIFIITGSRLMIRACSRAQRFGLDDWVIIPASLLVIAYLANIIFRLVYTGAGKHIWESTYNELSNEISWGNVNQVVFYCAVCLVKISMTLFNRRLTGISSARWQIVHSIFFGVLVLWFFLALFINIFQCSPVNAYFDVPLRGRVKNYHCIRQDLINNSFSAIHAVTDFMLLCVPVIIISRVQMPLWKKIRLCLLFALGSISCVASCIRISFGKRNSYDLTWVFYTEISWTIVDITFGVIVASLPAMNSVVEMLYSKAKTYGTGRSYMSSWTSSSNKRSGSDSATSPRIADIRKPSLIPADIWSKSQSTHYVRELSDVELAQFADEQPAPPPRKGSVGSLLSPHLRAATSWTKGSSRPPNFQPL